MKYLKVFKVKIFLLIHMHYIITQNSVSNRLCTRQLVMFLLIQAEEITNSFQVQVIHHTTVFHQKQVLQVNAGPAFQHPDLIPSPPIELYAATIAAATEEIAIAATAIETIPVIQEIGTGVENANSVRTVVSGTGNVATVGTTGGMIHNGFDFRATR